MADATGVAVANGQGLDDSTDKKPTGLMGNIGGPDFLRQLTIILILAICLALAVFVLMWAYEPDMRPLSRMETDELVQTLDYFDQNKIEYKVENNLVYIRDDQYAQIKLMLTRAGLSAPSDPDAGILMNDMGFGVSQRMEKERLKYNREKQLAMAIEALKPVNKAKVLLALPKENVFARKVQQPSATVVVTLGKGRMLSQEEIDSVVDIVASAVHGMSPSRVTVSDNNGRLLSSGSQDALSARSRREYELERKREMEYQEKIDSILIPVLGLGNYTSQVDVSMDFTTVEQTQRSFNPDLPAVRSEMLMEDNQSGNGAIGIPGALTNKPPVASDIPEDVDDLDAKKRSATPAKYRKESTRNYELDTTVSHTRQQVGIIQRLSVSVAVNYQSTSAEDGSVSQQPISDTQLQSIRRLLIGGLGFDVQRGDMLEVVSVPFVREQFDDVEAVPFYEQAWFLRIIKWVMGALIALVLILAVMRPMVKRLTTKEEPTQEDAMLLEGPVAGQLDDTMLAAQEALQDGDENLLASLGGGGGRIELPDLHKDEDVLRAVRALVANEPELSIQVVKSWLDQDA